jgi:hypothetical protein
MVEALEPISGHHATFPATVQVSSDLERESTLINADHSSFIFYP